MLQAQRFGHATEASRQRDPRQVGRPAKTQAVVDKLVICRRKRIACISSINC